MQTFNPRNLTFLAWRSIYLNIKEASWPIALRFGDSHLEHFQHFRVRLHEENYYFLQGLLTSWFADAKTKWWICGHEKFTNVALMRSWIGEAKVQVTGHRPGHRPQVTGQVTGHRSGHRSHKKTIGHWTKLFWTDVLLYKNKISQGTLMIFLSFKQY